MGFNITTIVYLRVLIIQIGSTIILMVVEAQGNVMLGFSVAVAHLRWAPCVCWDVYTNASVIGRRQPAGWTMGFITTTWPFGSFGEHLVIFQGLLHITFRAENEDIPPIFCDV